MRPLLEWCHAEGIVTLFSCQGDPANEAFGVRRAYVRFGECTSGQRFFHACLDLSSESPNLRARIANSSRDRRPTADAWEWQLAANGRTSRVAALEPTVYFVPDDLELLVHRIGSNMPNGGGKTDEQTPS